MSFSKRLRSETRQATFEAIRECMEHFDDDVDTLLYVTPEFDLIETAMSLIGVRSTDDAFKEMLYEDRIKIIVGDPTCEPIDLWDFHMGSFDIPRREVCKVVRIPPHYILQPLCT